MAFAPVCLQADRNDFGLMIVLFVLVNEKYRPKTSLPKNILSLPRCSFRSCKDFDCSFEIKR